MKKELLYMLNELEKREHENLMEKGISLKLDRSFEYYAEDLQKNCEYLVRKNAISMLKMINKQILSEDNN